MTRLVADASAMGRAILPDEFDERTEALHQILFEHELVEPCHWPIEVASLIVKASRRRRMSTRERDDATKLALMYLDSAHVERVSYPNAAIELAVKHHISAYDAAYLDLALRGDLPLLTKDIALRNAAATVDVRLLEAA